jgi:hypothetical protein
MNRIAWILGLSVFFIGSVLSFGIGPAWDEPDNIVAAGQYAQFFKTWDAQILTRRDPQASLFGGAIFSQEPSLARYPPVPLYLGTVATLAGEAIGWVRDAHGIIVVFHSATAAFFALLVITVYQFGRLLGLSASLSVFAAVATWMYPTLFGHGLSNLKDTAQVAMFTLSLYFLTRFTLHHSRGDLIKGAAIWGLALATKINAVYVPIIWFILDLGFKIKDLRLKHQKVFFLSPKSYVLHLKSYAVVLIIGLLTVFVVWPYLWFDPLARGMEVLKYFTTVGQGYRLFWDGVSYQVGVGEILWWYPWANVLVSTPPLLLFALFVGIVAVVRARETRALLLLVWIAIPLLRATFPNAAFYDGLRHFLEVIPACMLVAAFGVQYLGQILKRYTYALLAISMAVLLPMVWINTVYFPYSTGYLNGLARNPNTAFDRDIEALSVREAVAYAHQTYGVLTLWSPIGGHLSWYYLSSNDRYVYTADEADTIILVNKSSHIRQEEFAQLVQKSHRLDAVIERGGAVFAWVYRKI